MTVVEPGPAAHPSGLGHVLKRGATMAAIGVIICQIVTVVQTIVLGRLLGPEEVGLFAAGSVVMGVMMFVHSPIAQAVIQREHDLEDAANTALVASFATGLLLGLALLATAPLVGALFHDSRVGLIAAATSGLVFLHTWSSVPDALMQRAFQFKRRLIIDPAVALSFATVSIIFALLGYGAWAMVIGTYASTVTGVVLSWWMAKWRPFQGRPSFRIWREMAGFSWPLLIEGLADRLRDMFVQTLIGRGLGTAQLGEYRYAYRIASMPSTAVIQIGSYVLFPAFSRISGDAARFREAFPRVLGWMWFATLPAGALLIMMGEPVMVLLLGEEWRAAGAMAGTLAGLVVGMGLTSVSAESIKGAGRSLLLNWMTALGLVLGVLLIVVLMPYGLIGVGIAISGTHLVVGVVNVELARRVAGTSFRDVAGCLVPTAAATLLAFAVVFPLEHFFVRSDRHALPLGLASILAECLLFTLVYLGGLRFVSPNRFRVVWDVVERGGRKLRGGIGRVL